MIADDFPDEGGEWYPAPFYERLSIGCAVAFISVITVAAVVAWFSRGI